MSHNFRANSPLGSELSRLTRNQSALAHLASAARVAAAHGVSWSFDFSLDIPRTASTVNTVQPRTFTAHALEIVWDGSSVPRTGRVPPACWGTASVSHTYRENRSLFAELQCANCHLSTFPAHAGWLCLTIAPLCRDLISVSSLAPQSVAALTSKPHRPWGAIL